MHQEQHEPSAVLHGRTAPPRLKMPPASSTRELGACVPASARGSVAVIPCLDLTKV